jgi:ribosomal protein L17
MDITYERRDDAKHLTNTTLVGKKCQTKIENKKSIVKNFGMKLINKNTITTTTRY